MIPKKTNYQNLLNNNYEKNIVKFIDISDFGFV